MIVFENGISIQLKLCIVVFTLINIEHNNMINILNESSLHKTLKSYYSLQNEGSHTEVPQGPYIADIRTKDGSIIEIQTANLAHLRDKIQYCINEGIRIKVVYSLVTTKYIQTISSSDKTESKRKSPLHKNIYSIFKELTALYGFLLNKLFTLEVIEITMTEIRQTTQQPVQSDNKRRRFKKNWLKTGKKLEEIGKIHTFKNKKDYLKLLPTELPQEFTVKDLQKALTNTGIKATEQFVRCMIWVFCKAELLEHCGTLKRSHLYRVL